MPAIRLHDEPMTRVSMRQVEADWAELADLHGKGRDEIVRTLIAAYLRPRKVRMPKRPAPAASQHAAAARDDGQD